MTRALFYLLLRGFKNRLVARLKKLRQPRYLISVLAGLIYVCFVLWDPLYINPIRAGVNPEPFDKELLKIIESVFAVGFLGAIILPWPFSNTKTIPFNEAEILFLFGAPIRRSMLVNYRIAKALPGIFIAAIITVMIFGRGGFLPHSGYLFATLLVVYLFFFLYRIAVFLAKRRLAEIGITGGKGTKYVLGPLFIAMIITAVWIRSSIPPAPSMNQSNMLDFAAWLSAIAESGPIIYLLFPFRVLVHPAFAFDASHFMQSLVLPMIILFLIYGLIQCNNAGFNQAGSERAESDSSRINAQKGKSTVRLPVPRSRTLLFKLAPQGRSYVAIFWKNLASSGLEYSGITLRLLAGITLMLVLVVSVSGQNVATFIGAISSIFALFFTLFGPLIARDDLRMDLENIEMLKTYPIPGWGIVLGEILCPALLLAMLECSCVLLATIAMPSLVGVPLKVLDRVSIGFGAWILLPCFSLAGVLFQNAIVLILPGWVQIGKRQPQGVEAMGQRLISSLATLLFLLIAASPAALLFLAIVRAGYGILGTAIIPLASLMAALVLLVESGLAIFLLGSQFERLDASKEYNTALS